MANICKQCGTITGDYFLSNEIDCPFSPCNENDAKQIKYYQIKLSRPHPINTSWTEGGLELMLEYGNDMGELCISSDTDFNPDN